MSEEISKKLQDKLNKLNKQLKINPLEDTEFISSGSVIADTVLVDAKITKEKGIEGGIPTGKFIEVFGDPGCGKSTWILYACKIACHKGYRVAYLDVEGGVNESQLEGIGLTPFLDKNFFLFPITTFEEAEQVIDDLKDEDFLYFVIDSITSLIPAKLLEKSIAEVEPGIKSRYAGSFLEKYKSIVKGRKTSFIFINQVRTKLNFRGQSSVDSAGGYSVKFYMDIRLKLRKVKRLEKVMDTLEGRQSVEYGAETAISAVKNRFNKPFIEGNMHIIYGKGISNLSSYVKWLQNDGVITGGGGGWYTITLNDHEDKVRSLSGITGWIKDNLQEVQEYIDSKGGFLLVKEVGEDEE